MPNNSSISGSATLTLNGRVFSDFVDGDVVALTFENDKITLKTGKNGNTMFAFNESGREATLPLRILKGSLDDKFLTSEYNKMERDRAAYVLLAGELVFSYGDGLGNISNETYRLSGGVITKGVDGKDNTEGDTDQVAAVYNLKFARGERVFA